VEDRPPPWAKMTPLVGSSRLIFALGGDNRLVAPRSMLMTCTNLG
jgi:hypothetical protein